MEERRGARWWWFFAVGVIVLNAAGFVSSLFRGFDPFAGVVFLLASVLVGIGLHIKATKPAVGSSMIIIGSIPPILPFWLVIPALVSSVTIIGGLVTRELRFST